MYEELRDIEALERDPFNVINYSDKLESKEFLENYLIEMANVTGKFMKVEDIDFSFYFSKKNSSHGIRIKINWNRETMTSGDEGYIELHGNYNYYQSPKVKYKPHNYEIETVRYFARKYKVLFAAVWECKLDADTLSEYFKGRLSWQELMSCFENIPQEVKEVFEHCRGLKDLEFAVRKNSAFNMHDKE